MPPSINEKQLTLPTGSEPITPEPGETSLYVDTSEVVRQKTDAGAVSKLSANISVSDINAVSKGDNSIIRFPRGSRFDLGSNVISILTTPRYGLRRSIYGTFGPTMSWMGFASPTETSAGAAVVAEYKGKFLTRRFTSNAVAANSAGINSAALFRTAWSPFFSIRIHTGASIAAVRIWVGFFSAAPPNTATLGTTQAFGFAYFSSDGNLSSVTSNGTTTTRTTILTAASNTAYLLNAWVFGTTAYFQVNNGTIATSTTTLPATATNVGFYAVATNSTTTSNTFNVGRHYLECD